MFDHRIALSTREAAEAVGYSVTLIRRRIAEGKLPASRPDGTGDWRILRTDLIAWLKAEGITPARRETPTTRNRAA